LENIFINFFPFAKEAAEHLKDLEIDINTLPLDFPASFKEAFERLKNLIESSNLPEEIDTSLTSSEVLVYAIMRVFIELLDEDLLRNRFGEAFSKRTEKILLSQSSQEKNFLIKLALNTFNWQIKEETYTGVRKFEWQMQFNNFLEVAPSFIANDWKLINQEMHDGCVSLTKAKLIRLLAEKTKLYISKRKISREEIPEVSESYNSYLSELKSRVGVLRKNFQTQEVYSDEIMQTAYPPCIKFVLNKTEKGENLAHSERLFLTFFLLNIGTSIDEVMKIFATQPDFKEEMTRYQVEFAAGKKGSGTKYKPFGCAKLISFGLCKKELDQTDLCLKGKVFINKDLKNPIQYYRNRIYDLKKERKLN